MRIRCTEFDYTWTLEGSADAFVLRLLNALTGIEPHRITAEDSLTEDEVERLAQVIVSLRFWPITVQDDNGDGGEWTHLHERKPCQKLH